MHDESVTFFPGADGTVAPAPLLYSPADMLRVVSADLTTKYREGEDWALEGGTLRRVPGGRIPCFDEETFYPAAPGQVPIRSARRPDRHVLYDPDGRLYARMQTAVTYRHAGRWDGPVPGSREASLPGTFRRLRAKQALRIVFFGDSVMVGCDVSGRRGEPPYLPPGDELLVLTLRSRYAHSRITRVNTAVGGTDSSWGRKNAARLVAAHRPDLVVVGFGMNDGSREMPAAQYRDNIADIVGTVRGANAAAEFLLLSPGLPNPDCVGWSGTQADFAPALEDLCAALPGCAHLGITGIHQYLYTRKRWEDMASNGVNHPNDFLARVGAQAMAACFIP